MNTHVRYYIWWMVGFIVGFGLELFICSRRKDGVIHITHEEDGDKYLFEFNIIPEKIPAMNQVVFKTSIEKNEQKIQSL